MKKRFESMGYILSIITSICCGYFLGWPGVLLGIFISFFLSRKINGLGSKHAYRQQQIFFNTTFRVMGHLAKADGTVTQHSIDTASLIIKNMNLNEQAQQQARQCFRQGKSNRFNLKYHMKILKLICHNNPHLADLFMEIQSDMAYAEGPTLSANKRRILSSIARQIGVPSHTSSRYQKQNQNQQQDYSYKKSYSSSNRKYTTRDDYAILGVSPSDSLANIKKAYRRLISQYHPDRMIAQNLSAEKIKEATEKTQRIKASFERIEKNHSTQ